MKDETAIQGIKAMVKKMEETERKFANLEDSIKTLRKVVDSRDRHIEELNNEIGRLRLKDPVKRLDDTVHILNNYMSMVRQDIENLDYNLKKVYKEKE